MNKQVLIPGFCPNQNKDYNISITYLENKSLSQTRTPYIKGLMSCDYVSIQHNICPLANDCPIYKNAPAEIF